MDKELKSLKSKIRYLEDRNFILETKLKVYENIIKNCFLVIELVQTILTLINPSKKDLFDFFEEYIQLPIKTLDIIHKQLNDYEHFLAFERRKIFKNDEYQPFKIEGKNLSYINTDFLKFKNIFENNLHNLSSIEKYSRYFLDDLSGLLFKHSIDINLTEFLNLFEASKFIFKLLGIVFIKFPYPKSTDIKINLDETFQSILDSVEENFGKYCVVAFEKIKIVPSLEDYMKSLIELFINNLNDKLLFKNTFIELMKYKTFYLEKYSSYIDQKVFNKFSEIMVSKNKNYDKPKLTFKIDDSDILDFSNYMNICFSITNLDTECESLMNSYLIENILLKKFLKCAIEQIGVDVKDLNIINPIKAIINYKSSL